jgi:phosphoribosylformimino-5-aminoimidazole carboxamide ribotide isomerase
MRIYPAIDLIEGKTVRLVQGEYDRKLSYDITPTDAAKKWASMGAEYIHVVDLDGARKGEPVNLGVVADIVKSTAGVPVEVGGGYRTLKDIYKALVVGVRRVIVGSQAFKDPDFALGCVKEFGDRVIFSVDAKSGQIMSEGWEASSGRDDIGMIKIFVEKCGVEEIIYTDISKDGMLTGPDLDNLKRILGSVDVKVISAGGVKTVDHVRQLVSLGPGISGAVIGRALYDGTIDLKEAINAGETNNTVS